MMYAASCINEDGQLCIIERDYPTKKDFYSDLRGNGYKVKFIASADNYEFDIACEKYHERLEKKRRESAIRRKCEREWRERDKKFAEELEKRLAAEEETTEEATQEAETMRFKKDYFAVITKKIDKYSAIRFDSDISFEITNCTEEQEPAAIKKALEKFVDELKKHGGAEILVDSLEMSIKFDEFGPECTFNEIQNGGNAYEIEINRYNDTSLSIYIRICEHQDAPESEPAADQTAETYSAWCGMIENDVITEEYETMSEAIDEVETKYDKEEQKALGVTYCRLLCTADQWLECLEEKKIEDIYFFDKGRVIYDNRSGNYFRIDSELDEVRGAYWCTMVELDDTGDISAELSAGWMTKSEVNRCTDI